MTVRVGVAGLGIMGLEHVRQLVDLPLAEVVACCDPSPGAQLRAPKGVPAFGSVPEMVRSVELDGVVIASPPDAHIEPVRSALEAGLHVLCEKPLATSLAHAQALLDLDARFPERLVIGHVRRFDPRFVAVRAALDDGVLGRPLHLTGMIQCPRADAERLAASVSLALELAVHDIDIMRWLAGDVLRVHAESVDVFPTRGPDAFTATLAFASGAVGALHHGWTLPAGTPLDFAFRFTVAGTDGFAEIDGTDRGVALFGPKAPELYPDTVSRAAVRAQDEQFLRRIRDGDSWPVSVADAYAAVSVALAIDASIARGLPVTPQRPAERVESK